jgi:hypothetical protein
MTSTSSNSTTARQLARRVQSLPFELRETVYCNLWTKEAIKNLDCPFLSTLNDRAREIYPHDIPNFVQPRCVGHDFAHEAVLWLYNNYPGFNLRSLEDIPKFLTTDVFDIGLSPSHDQVRLRRLHVHFDLVTRRRPGHCKDFIRVIQLSQEYLAPLADFAKLRSTTSST